MGQAKGFGDFREWPALPAVLAPAVLWGLTFVIVPAGRQEFPINDDCLFARTAFAFARGEGLHYYHWASMPLLGQLLWSWPFIRLLGESHFALRLSTMTLAVLGLAAFYELLRREYDHSTRRAAFVAACLGLNPLFFLLACTYQSDAPALAFSLLALALYCRGLRGGRLAWWAGGMALAVLAVCTRQNAIVVPVAAGMLLWRRPDLRRRPLWVLGSLVPVAAGVGIYAWFNGRPDAWPLAPRWQSGMTAPVLVFLIAHTLGLSALPAVPLSWKRSGKTFIVSATVLLAVASCLAALEVPPFGGLFPYLGDWLTPWGQFTDKASVGDRPLLMGREMRTALTLAGCLGGAALAAGWAARHPPRWPSDPLLLFACLHFPLLLIAPSVYDRYLLVFLPAGLTLLTPAAPSGRWRRGLAFAGLVLYGGLSFAFLHDLLAWNSARWELGRRAVAAGVAPEDMEGGFQWDGWFAPEAAAEKVDRPPSGLALRFTRKFFPAVTGRYALSFSALSGRRVLDAEPYRLWLVPGTHRIFLLEATDDSPP